jgi:hypothetical protein
MPSLTEEVPSAELTLRLVASKSSRRSKALFHLIPIPYSIFGIFGIYDIL